MTQSEFELSNETAALYYAIGVQRKVPHSVSSEATKVSYKDPKSLSRLDKRGGQPLNPLSGAQVGLEAMLNKLIRPAEADAPQWQGDALHDLLIDMIAGLAPSDVTADMLDAEMG